MGHYRPEDPPSASNKDFRRTVEVENGSQKTKWGSVELDEDEAFPGLYTAQMQREASIGAVGT